jgi:protein TonB
LPPVALDPVRIEFDRLPSSTSPLLEPVSPGVLGLDAVDSSPQSVAQAEPVYPFQASLRRIEGFVVVEFIVTSEGRTRELQVVESSPPAVFEAAALQAVKQWTFDPAVKNGRAVDVRVRQRVAFRLDP